MTPEIRQNAVSEFARIWLDVHGTEQEGRPSPIAFQFYLQMSSVCKVPAAVQFLELASHDMLGDALTEIKRRYDLFETVDRWIAASRRVQ